MQVPSVAPQFASSRRNFVKNMLLTAAGLSLVGTDVFSRSSPHPRKIKYGEDNVVTINKDGSVDIPKANFPDDNANIFVALDGDTWETTARKIAATYHVSPKNPAASFFENRLSEENKKIVDYYQTLLQALNSNLTNGSLTKDDKLRFFTSK